MDRQNRPIDRTVRRLDLRRFDPIAATEAARDLRALALRQMVFRPVGAALRALWRGLTRLEGVPPMRRESTGG